MDKAIQTISNKGYFSPLDDEKLISQLKDIKHVALDMDGTIYMGTTIFPYTIPFLKKLDELSISYSFLTNNPSKNINDYISKLAKMGISITRSEIYTTTLATIDYIKCHYPDAKRLFLLGTESMIEEFESAGYISTEDSPDDIPDLIIASFDLSLQYNRLCRAAWWISQDIPYIATNPDRVCPTNERTILVDCGSICASLTYATGRQPDIVLGKPDPNMLSGIMRRASLEPHQIAMVGDRLYTDIAMADNAGAFGVLVLSGETTIDVALSETKKPPLIAQSIEVLGNLLEESRG